MHEGWFTEDTTHGPVKVDTFDESRPHEGKVLGIVQAHADDMPLCSGGLVAKLVAEGYRAFIIQTTNDEKCGAGTIADAIKSNEVEVDALASCLGIEDVFNLGYRNHRQDENSIIEQRCRLIFLFRHLRVDTVMSFHPWAKWEENPDHYVTGQAVEAAKWMAGGDKDYPEHALAGVEPYSVSDQWYLLRPIDLSIIWLKIGLFSRIISTNVLAGVGTSSADQASRSTAWLTSARSSTSKSRPWRSTRPRDPPARKARS